jgi:Outer membrane protein beta-barrel domain
MRPPFVNAPLGQLIVLSALVALSASPLHAQAAGSPIRRALYVALGGDPVQDRGVANKPVALSVGIEQTRAGSRWGFRLGADYRRQTSSFLSHSRWEDFGLGISARYGRASGVIRPYLLGGVGVANLRTRVRDARYYADPDGLLFPPQSYDRSLWNGSLTTGLGTDVTLGRFRLFTEARMNIYPAHLSAHPATHSNLTTKALYFGIKF